MNKKYIITALIFLLAGLLGGKLLFSDKSVSKKQTTTEKTEAQAHWTCSMHPQIDLPEPGQCPICGMDLIPKTDDAGVTATQIKLTENAMALADIQTIKAGTTTGSEKGTVTYPGTIAVNEDLSATQTAHFGGRIEKLYYQSKGDYIRKGSKIADLYSPELVTAQNELLEAYYIKKEQPELYTAVRNKLKNWKLSEAQIQRIENTKKVQSLFPMYADKSGYIEEVLVKNGNHVKEGSPLYKLAELNRVRAIIEVYEQDLAKIKTGQRVRIRLNAYPEKILTGKISYISPLLNPQTRTAEVRIELPNPQNRLKPGMLLTAEIAQTEKKSTAKIRIPATAVLWTGKRSIVYVKTDPAHPVFELREVVLGEKTGDTYEILSGLQAGEEVVTYGAFTIDAAAQLQGKKSMMNAGENSQNNTKPEVKSVQPAENQKEIPRKKESQMKCAPGKCGSNM